MKLSKLGTVFAALIALIASARPGAAVVTLPIEVFGLPGAAQSVRVRVPNGKGTAVRKIRFTANNLSYEGKIVFKANKSAWYPIKNSTVTVSEPAKSYGGIGGAISYVGNMTVTLSLPTGVIKDGPNDLTFRFSGTNGVSNGYRIIAFNLEDAAGKDILDSSEFKLDDPTTWEPPLPGASDIASGKTLWESAELNESPLVKRPLAATCGGTKGCHLATGYDLKYFNYSNRVIVERAKFHGLSKLQGEQIASYIRTLRGPAPSRPWYPVYQPGPGVDAKPVTSWAAGAGYQWVLPNDTAMLPYIFPNGITKAAVSTKGYLNAREMPLAMQFPDWKHWLPRIHPADAWGEAFETSAYAARYLSIRNILSNTADLETYVKAGKLQTELSGWSVRRTEFLTPRQQGPWTPDYSEQVYSTAKWQLVKTFEFMHEFGLEGYGPLPDTRTWYGNIAFAVSPFMLKIPSTENGVGGSAVTNEYLASVWYAVQLAVNPTNQGKAAGQSPMDWAYTYGKLKDLYLSASVRVPEPYRLSFLVAKAGQIWDNANGLDKFRGWHPEDKADVSRLVHINSKPMWEGVPADTRKAVLEAVLEAWFDKTVTYPADEYWAKGYADPSEIPTPNYSGTFGQKVAYMIPEFRAYGVSPTLLARIETWAKTVWPLGPWKVGAEDTPDP